MKNNEFQKGIEDIQDIKLSSDEKVNLFSYLDTYVEDHPILSQPKVSIWSGFVMHYRHSYALGALVLCIFVGASVTFAAESALPGDVLYPVKIYVNEPVKAVTKITPKAKADFEEEKVIKRLDEVRALVKEGKFDDKKRALVEKEVEKSASAIKVHKVKKNDTAEEDKDSQDDATNIDFEAKVDTRLDSLRDVKDKVDAIQNVEVEKFEIKIKDQLGNLTREHDDNKDDNEKEKRIRGLLR